MRALRCGIIDLSWETLLTLDAERVAPVELASTLRTATAGWMVYPMRTNTSKAMVAAKMAIIKNTISNLCLSGATGPVLARNLVSRLPL